MILEVKNLSFSYAQGRTIFEDVSFGLKEGEILSILGTNGAGKSTLLNCIANLFKPAKGEILLDDKPMSKMDLKDIAKLIGYVPQVHNPAYSYNVIDFVVMGRTPYIGYFSSPQEEDYAIAEEALKKLNIYHLADKAYTEISGGERQQATIARVMAQDPKVILLDEPTAHLDYGNQLRTVHMIKQLAEAGYAVIMTTHTPDHVIILGGHVGILNKQGRFEVGAMESMMSSERLSQLYQMELGVLYIEQAKRKACIAISV